MRCSWLTYLAVFTLSFCHQKTMASLTVSQKEIRAGDSYNVTCRWDNASVSSENIKIEVARRRHGIGTRNATATTVVDSVSNATVGQWHYECLWNGRTLAWLQVPVGARLQVEDFECRINLYDATMMTNCSFSKPNGGQLDAIDVSFYLRVNGLPPVQCTDYPHNATRMLCIIDPGVMPKTRFEPSHNYTLIMSDQVGNQTQHFIRTQAQERVLDWPNKEQPLLRSGNYHCLTWQKSLWSEYYYQNGSIDWHVRVIPLNDAIPETESPPYEVRYCGTTCEQFCLHTPPHPNQQFELRLRRRFNLSEAPWSETIMRQLLVPKAIPSRPPRLLPNGFFLDPRSQGLYIFWEPLLSLEHNAPNLTYSLTASDGKEASPIGRNFAVFPQWDDSRDSTISVYSENSEGRSLNCSDLYVPIMDGGEDRQPQALKYDKTSHTLSWTAPGKSSGLLHYTVYWCSPVNDTQKICDDSQAMQLLQLEDAGRQEHRFDRSMELINLGVAATYRDEVDSGGMTWLRVGLPTEADPGRSRYLEGIVALIVLCLIFISYRKLHRCSGIGIEFPNGVYDDEGKPQRTRTDGPADDDDDTADPKDTSQQTSSGIQLVVMEPPKEHTKAFSKPVPVTGTVKPWIALAGTLPAVVVKAETNQMPDVSGRTCTIDDDITPIQIEIETDTDIRATPTDGYLLMPSTISQRERESKNDSVQGYMQLGFNNLETMANGYMKAPSFRLG
ncbi:cytokine receptor isoform X2 [Drosophila guanche]|uniref:cytokine receptor isoform X2 n=1 Tax=Drosophila guanche TaxID=7266 RepID=UPI001470870A|nr:cytokine receptor isoform X2 [Drosophila guanche]